MSLRNERLGKSRRRVRLPGKLENTLGSYVAAMAGTGLLALAPSAEGKIVYTPTHKIIPSNTSLKLDLNADGIADFVFENIRMGSARLSHATGFPTSHGYLRLIGQLSQNLAVGHTSVTLNLADALNAKAKIGPSAGFLSDPTESMEFCFKTPENSSVLHGSWLGVSNKYVGLKFQIEGQTHYGWARLSGVRQGPNLCSLTAVLTGYAYETIPNQPILAGKTSGTQARGPSNALLYAAPQREERTLGLLAQGARALEIWRRPEESLA